MAAAEVVQRVLDFAFMPNFEIPFLGATDDHSLLDATKARILQLSSRLGSPQLPKGLFFREARATPPDPASHDDGSDDYWVTTDGSFAVTTDEYFVLVKNITITSRCTCSARSEFWCIAWASESSANFVRLRARVVLWTLCSGSRISQTSGIVRRAAHYFSPSAAPEFEILWTPGESVEVHGLSSEQMPGNAEWVRHMDDFFGDVVVYELEDLGLSDVRFGRVPQLQKRTFRQDTSGAEGVMAEVGVLPLAIGSERYVVQQQ
eukprot:gnl/MRDRNA2_/MRDRNA2_161701_c0_seq1.p1 gnl/MRDRNA2_/MRDRNA2_161701_c0~~gnl/MRDRNA2_/MRDRNA2_161701_c0_seq1.p1  ORF type:complete len:274 (+),score=42.99 gnl/MRDRNA2_/MRDRNA2_161701_c0_seq1:37-822(+)